MDQFYAFGPARYSADLEGRTVLIDQAMQMLGISRRTVYYWIRQGRLRTIRARGGSQRVLLSSMRGLKLYQRQIGGGFRSAVQAGSPDQVNGLTA